MKKVGDSNLKPCPFCGSTKLDISSKRAQTYDITNYRVCVYCKNCNSYGPRVLVRCNKPNTPNYLQFMTIDYNEEAKNKAIEAWNKRSK